MADDRIFSFYTQQSYSPSELAAKAREMEPQKYGQMGDQQIVDDFLSDPKYMRMNSTEAALTRTIPAFAAVKGIPLAMEFAGNVGRGLKEHVLDAAVSLGKLGLGALDRGQVIWKPEENPANQLMSYITSNPKRVATDVLTGAGKAAVDLVNPAQWYRDPVGNVMNVAGLAGGVATGAKATGAVAKAAKAANVANKAGAVERFAGAVSDVASPMVFSRLRNKVADSELPERIYAATVTPINDQSLEQFNDIVRFAVRDQKQVGGTTGIDELKSKISARTAYMDETAQQLKAQGDKFNLYDHTKALKDEQGKIKDSRFYPSEVMRVLEGKKKEFLVEHGKMGLKNAKGKLIDYPTTADFNNYKNQVSGHPLNMDPEDARALWKGANRELGDLTTDQAENLSAKALAIRAGRQAIVDWFRDRWGTLPKGFQDEIAKFGVNDLKELGIQESKLIDLQRMIETELKRKASPNTSSNVYALAHTWQSLYGLHFSPIAIATLAKKALGPEVVSRIALRIAEKNPAWKRRMLAAGMVAGEKGEKYRQAKTAPPTPQTEIPEIPPDWR